VEISGRKGGAWHTQLLSSLLETRNVHTYFGQYLTLRDIREQLIEEDLEGTRGFIKYATPVLAQGKDNAPES